MKSDIHGRQGVDANKPWNVRIGNGSDTYGPAGLYEERTGQDL